MDSRGNISLEIGIVLIIVLMITGVVLSLSEISTQKIVKESENEHIETLIGQSVNNLINNPGTPQDWEVHEKGIPGLAIVNEENQIIPNSVSYSKLMALSSNYDKYVNKYLFDSKIKTSMELIPYKSSISSVKIGNAEDSNNVHSVNRLVKCDFFKKYVIKDFQNDGKCNRNHDQDSHSCNYFKIFKGNLRTSNYYLLIDDSEKYNLKYFLDTTRLVKEKSWKTLISNRVYLNDEINFYDDTSAVVFIHLDKKDAKAILVSVPKTFDKDKLKYDYFTTNDCEFILKAWY
ncbi:hypothetical protein [Methanobrevibacter sp.]|uniref:hypothetical protein n=1 Tax=Methanobrevibacter sp. TaxID=66852 RepID=UPI0026E092C4|nr:hypothetical protein [Methanobrevibacter sp.]MDO5860117.1 hypothetical protein [Methanobrevibacter sp.]